MEATLILFSSRFDKIFVYMFKALFDILYATESVNSQTSIDPIFEEIVRITPLFGINSISGSVKKTVPLTLISNVWLKESLFGFLVSRSGPIPALLIKISIQSKFVKIFL